MTVDIIIPTYKPDETLCLLLHKLQGQTFVVHRVIILNTEEELWKQAAAAYPIEQVLKELPCEYEVFHIAKKDFDHGGTRQFGAEHSDADVMVFMTQDAVPADEFLVEKLVESLLLKEDQVSARVQQNAMEVEGTEKSAKGDCLVAVAYARQLPKNDCHIVEQYTRQFNYPEESRVKWLADLPELGIKTYFCSNVCAMYKRELYLQLGGFVKKTIFNEDMIFAGGLIQKGYGVAYAAEAKVVHSHNYSAIQQFHRNFDLAVSQADHPEVFDGIRSEGEGIRLVKKTAGWLCRQGKPWLVIQLVWQSGWKYLGYLLGEKYRKLPRWVIDRCTMNPKYWE